MTVPARARQHVFVGRREAVGRRVRAVGARGRGVVRLVCAAAVRAQPAAPAHAARPAHRQLLRRCQTEATPRYSLNTNYTHFIQQ
jgi:hypothetical protein